MWPHSWAMTMASSAPSRFTPCLRAMRIVTPDASCALIAAPSAIEMETMGIVIAGSLPDMLMMPA